MPLFATALLPTGDLVVGGTFPADGGAPAFNLASLTVRPACPADLNCSTHLEVQDIFDFLTAWFNNDLAADFNGGGISV